MILLKILEMAKPSRGGDAKLWACPPQVARLPKGCLVPSDFAPPIMGWQNYVPLYERQKAAFASMQLVRRNTIIFPHGDVAWAMYQWEFSALLNGAPYDLRGQTTLVFNKVGGNWLIVHNHTSSTPTQTAQAPMQTHAATLPLPATAKP